MKSLFLCAVAVLVWAATSATALTVTIQDLEITSKGNITVSSDYYPGSVGDTPDFSFTLGSSTIASASTDLFVNGNFGVVPFSLNSDGAVTEYSDFELITSPLFADGVAFYRSSSNIAIVLRDDELSDASTKTWAEIASTFASGDDSSIGIGSFSENGSVSNFFSTAAQSGLNFDVTGLAEVPLPAGGLLLLGALGALGAARRRIVT